MGVVRKQTDVEQGLDHWELDLSEHQLDMELVSSVFFHCVKKMHIFKAFQEMKLKNMMYSVCSLQPYTVNQELFNVQLHYCR
jgi:hypothetical protein